MMSTQPTVNLESSSVDNLVLTETADLGVSVENISVSETAGSSTSGTQQDLESLENLQAELDRFTEVIPDSNMAEIVPKIEEIEVKTTSEVVVVEEPRTQRPPITTVSSSPKETNIPIKVLQLSNNLLNNDKLVLPESVLADISKLHGPVYLVPTSSMANLNLTTANTVSTATIATTTSASGLETKPVVKKTTLPSGQVITKVIITSNPVAGQSGSQQVCLTPVSCATSTTPSNTITIGGQAMKIVATTTQQQTASGGVLSPGKMVTFSQALLGSPNKQHILTTIPGTPPKQGIVLGKIPITPNSKGTPTKIMIPVNMMKSPQRIAPAPITATVSTISVLTTGTATTTKTMSPNKLIIRQALPVTGGIKPGQATLIGQPAVTNSTSVKQIAVPISTSGSMPVQVPGSKFHYVRLVTSGANSTSKPATVVPVATTKTIATLANTPTTVKIALPIAPAGQQTGKRILIPATGNVTQMRTATNVTVGSNTLAPLPPGTTLISTGGNIVMVPAQYMTQFQQQFGSQTAATGNQAASAATPATNPQPILPAHTTSSSSPPSFGSASASAASYDQNQSSSKQQVNGSSLEANGVRPRKPCNCTKSQCLKLYCDCFANGEFCNSCNCNNCYNNLDHEEERQKAIRACLDRNPLAFHPKIGKGKGGEHERRHNKGCNCKRSGCLKNYCECYEAKIMCTSMCKCVGCKNFEESAERKTLMHLADAAEVRVLQQIAAKTKFSQVQDVPQKMTGSASGERLPFSFVTPDVLQATCQCLLAQAEEGEKCGYSEEILERMVLEEFGQCLRTIIEYANRTKGKPASDSARSRNNANS